MKTLLWMICLCITVQVAPQMSQMTPRRFTIQDFNGLRHEFARDYNISNMNILEYNHDLEDKAKKLSCDAKHGRNYRVFLEPNISDPFTAKIVLHSYDDTTAEQLIEMMDSDKLEFLEMLLPKQMFIGCAPIKCARPLPTRGELSFWQICILGPNGTIEKPQFGRPGSNCGNAGNATAALCKHDGSASPQPIDLNEPIASKDGSAGNETQSTLSSSSSKISFFIIPLILLLVIIV